MRYVLPLALMAYVGLRALQAGNPVVAITGFAILMLTVSVAMYLLGDDHDEGRRP